MIVMICPLCEGKEHHYVDEQIEDIGNQTFLCTYFQCLGCGATISVERAIKE
jgi:hypothetical protein